MMELDYKEIGRNVRAHRIAKGLKQKELAELVNVSDQHISHIETAHTQLSLPTLIALCNVLEVDCNTLLGKNLTGARGAIQRQRLEELCAQMARDPRKLDLFVELGQTLTRAEL